MSVRVQKGSFIVKIFSHYSFGANVVVDTFVPYVLLLAGGGRWWWVVVGSGGWWWRGALWGHGRPHRPVPAHKFWPSAPNLVLHNHIHKKQKAT